MMLNMPVSRMIELVRKNLDEIAGHETQMIGQDYDDSFDISVIVMDCVPEAIRQVHLSADISLLEGKEAEEDDYEVEGNIIKMKVPVLRLVSFKAKESPYVINEAFPEGSPVGRMQQNEFVKGTYDNPVLISKGINAGASMPVWSYYSFKDENDAVEYISYIPYPEDHALFYDVSPNLVDALINALSMMVKNIYSIQAQ